MSLCVLTQCLCFILLKSEFRPNLQLSFHKRYTHLYKRTTEKNKPISLAFCSRLKNHISRKRTVKTQRKASIAEGQTMYFLDPHFLSLLGSPVLKSIKVRARKSRWPPPTTQDFLSTPNLTVQQYKTHTHTHTHTHTQNKIWHSQAFTKNSRKAFVHICINNIHAFVCLIAQSCLTLCNPMDYSPPGSSIHGLLQARIMEWVAIPFPRGFSPSRDRSWVSYSTGGFFTNWATRE